jgi:LmbE family N-acetylglucosaminyl deacetylase
MKSVVCIFAHPDDEAFGPSGTIALLAKKHPVYIICVTNGDAGKNSSKAKKELGIIRKEEVESSAKILGVKKVFFLGYKDGCLCNSIYHEMAEKIIKIVTDLKSDTLLTFEERGVSGHIDHVTVSMVTTYVFKKLDFIKKLLYYCLGEKHRELEGEDYFIYFPKGYKKHEIDEVYDTTLVWEQKVAAIKTHDSQKHDGESVLRIIEQLPKEEHFLVKTK